jgi:hypothetical protein
LQLSYLENLELKYKNNFEFSTSELEQKSHDLHRKIKDQKSRLQDLIIQEPQIISENNLNKVATWLASVQKVDNRVPQITKVQSILKEKKNVIDQFIHKLNNALKQPSIKVLEQCLTQWNNSYYNEELKSHFFKGEQELKKRKHRLDHILSTQDNLDKATIHELSGLDENGEIVEQWKADRYKKKIKIIVSLLFAWILLGYFSLQPILFRTDPQLSIKRYQHLKSLKWLFIVWSPFIKNETEFLKDKIVSLNSIKKLNQFYDRSRGMGNTDELEMIMKSKVKSLFKSELNNVIDFTDINDLIKSVSKYGLENTDRMIKDSQKSILQQKLNTAKTLDEVNDLIKLVSKYGLENTDQMIKDSQQSLFRNKLNTANKLSEMNDLINLMDEYKLTIPSSLIQEKILVIIKNDIKKVNRLEEIISLESRASIYDIPEVSPLFTAKKTAIIKEILKKINTLEDLDEFIVEVKSKNFYDHHVIQLIRDRETNIIDQLEDRTVYYKRNWLTIDWQEFPKITEDYIVDNVVQTKVKTLNTELTLIFPGHFDMGNNRFFDEKPEHQVYHTKPFWVSTREISYLEWEKIMPMNRPKYNEAYEFDPQESITWEQAMEFCQRLTKIERDKGYISNAEHYTLLTEAQWEYCAISSKTGKNIWSLKGMYNSYGEWVRDYYHLYSKSKVKYDPIAGQTSEFHIYRGMRRNRTTMTSKEMKTKRFKSKNSHTSIYIGFRLSLQREK